MDKNLIEVINQMFIMVLLGTTGFILKKIKMFNRNGDKVISNFIINVTTPALIIATFNIPFKIELLRNIIYIALFTVILLTFAALFSNLYSKLLKLSGSKKSLSRFVLIFVNSSFLAFPLCYALFGEIGLLYAAVFDLIQNFFFWTLGVYLVRGNENKQNLIKNLINPNVVAMFIGITLFILNIQLPDFIKGTLEPLGKTTIPLALIMVGSILADLETEALFNNTTVYINGFARLLLLPLIAGVMLLYIPLPTLVKSILILEFSMPCAASAVVLARNYNSDFHFASQNVFLITLLSIFTIPTIVLIIFRLFI